MRKIDKYLSFLFIFFLFACYNPRIPVDVVKAIEQEDDNLCKAQGIDFNKKDLRKLYWRCRLNIINQRINGEFDNYGYSAFYKNEFKKIRRIIKNRIRKANNIKIEEAKNFIDETQQNRCFIVIEKANKNKKSNREYKNCLKYLNKNKFEDSKFIYLSNEEFFNYLVSDSEEEKIKLSDDIFIDRECIKYMVNQNKLNECQKALDKIKKCEINNMQDINQRRIDDDIYCKKLSIKKYPDSLAKFNSDNENKGIMSVGPKMDKINIFDLRQKEFNICKKERKLKLLKYKEYLENKCKVMHLKKIKEK